MNASLVPVPFHGHTLFLLDQNNEPYTPMKPIVEGMGLAWQVQHRKLDSNKERWGITMMVIPSKSGDQETLCMPLRKLPGWLMTIHPSRVKPEIREKIIQYQNECDDVLWKYWTEGHATNPQILTISPSQQHELQQIVARRAGNSGKLRSEIWSRFNNRFRIARYAQLPASRFDEAKRYLETMSLKGDNVIQLLSEPFTEIERLKIESVTIEGVPALPREERNPSLRYGREILQALRNWSKDTQMDLVHHEVSRGLDALDRVLTRAYTEMDEASLHLAVANRYLKRWSRG